jgi:hypothetical protein
MAHFDTSLVLEAITNEVLADHETNRQIIELIEDTRDTERGDEGDRRQLVWGVLELALRQMAKSQHGHDLVVGLIDRLMEEARAESLARIELMAAGMVPYEVEETLREFPEVAGKYMRHPTRQELDEGGAI